MYFEIYGQLIEMSVFRSLTTFLLCVLLQIIWNIRRYVWMFLFSITLRANNSSLVLDWIYDEIVNNWLTKKTLPTPPLPIFCFIIN